MSEVRGRSREDPRPERRRPRGVTPRLRSGVAERSYPKSKVRGIGRDELPHVRGQGRQPRGSTQCLRLGAVAKRSYPRPRPGVAAGRTYPTPKAGGGGWEDLPHAGSQGHWPGAATPPPRSGGCVGEGGPRGAIPCSRSEGAVVRRYPLSKVRSSGCTLLEQP